MTTSNGRSKGWGLIEFDKPSTASAAVRKIHDTTLNGRLVFAREDRERVYPASIIALSMLATYHGQLNGKI